MTLTNPIKVSGAEPVNNRKAIMDLVKGRFDALLTNLPTSSIGIRPLNAIGAFPAILFVSGKETPVDAKYVNTIIDSVFTITLMCYAQAENPEVLDEQLNNFIHAVKKIAFTERDGKYGDTNHIIVDAIPGEFRDVNEFLPLEFVGFEFDLEIKYRQDKTSM